MSEYPGGKGGSGVYQKIISLMPKHRVYIEGFLGNGSILRLKKPAQYNFGIEIDYKVIADYWNGKEQPNLFLRNECFFDFLNYFQNKFFSKQKFQEKEILFYLDPPYLQSTRRQQRQIYRYEMLTEQQHFGMLATLIDLPFNVMISGYDSPLYNEILSTWRKVSFTGVSRGGRTTEIVWMNFPEPLELHDYKFLGDDYRKRQDIQRKIKRWTNRLKNMRPQERFAFLAALEELKSDQATAEMPL